MARSPIQSKKQGIKSNRGGGWKQQKEQLDKFKKVGQAIYGGLHNIGGFRKLPPPMTHKELFWENDTLIV